MPTRVNLVNFVKRMRKRPNEIVRVHGDYTARRSLQSVLAYTFSLHIQVTLPEQYKID